VTLSERQQVVKKMFVAVRGEWDERLDTVLELDPEFVAAYIKFARVSQEPGGLDGKTRAYVGLAVDAAVTTLHSPGVRHHIKAALLAGATPREVLEVLECTATLAIHSMNVGVPVLTEILAEQAVRTQPAPLDDYQQRLKSEFTEKRGYWNATWDEMLELDPRLFEVYTEFSAHPWMNGTLSPKVREFIYMAFDTSSTHLYRVGLKLHIENALRYGATVRELLQVMEIASIAGMHTLQIGAPLLRDVMDELEGHPR
jgi:alkylhydroperoxidase/carboxymuconolactone decarboxylase family protein YurZ